MAPGVTKVDNGGPLTTHSAGKFQITFGKNNDRPGSKRNVRPSKFGTT